MNQIPTVTTDKIEQSIEPNSILSQKDLNQRYGLSRTRQWYLRKSGKLSFLDFENGRVGYLPEHVYEYLRRCERKAVIQTLYQTKTKGV